MSDWGWVTFGYAVVYGTMVTYGVFLAARFGRARRRLDQIE